MAEPRSVKPASKASTKRTPKAVTLKSLSSRGAEIEATSTKEAMYDATKFPVGVGSLIFTTNGTTDEATFGALTYPFQLEYANLYVQAAIPEPGTYALMLAGLAATSLALRRRKA